MASVADHMTTDEAAFDSGGGSRTVVAGHYELDLSEPLGSGGMAMVYHGRDLRTRRDVALKTLRVEYRRDPETRARFRREARTMAFLTHPNVARVYDLFEDDEAPWVIIEYVPGRSLKEEVARRGPFSVEETALILEQVARALDHLHGRGLVHLDVKPQNLIKTPDGIVKLIDFGLAQQAGAPQETIGGNAFGTAAYLAPEQACGEAVDASTDVYSLGCVVYELLTGRPPFESGSHGEPKNDLIRAHLTETPRRPSEVRPDLDLPAWVDDAVLLALAKEPADRYQECSTFSKVYRSGLEEAAALEDRPTIAMWSSGVVDAHREREFAADGNSRFVARRLGSAVYRTGGRAARHTGWLQRLLWRSMLAVAVGNALLAGLLYVQRGEIPGILPGSASLASGNLARVTTDRLRLRAAPGRSSEVIESLPLGQRVTITGGTRSVEGEDWLPVRVGSGNSARDGYLVSTWLQAERRTGMTRLDSLVDRGKSIPNSVLDRLHAPEEYRL
ncbi:MAG: serine/threonine protein kinase [Thermomicrobiales bacterium]